MGQAQSNVKLRTFSCFTTDARYSAPTLQFVLAETEDRARVLAHRILVDDPRHLMIEVREADKVLFCERRADSDGDEPGKAS